jgi:protein tyrosine/serine phosphatase
MFGVGRLYEVIPGRLYAGPRPCALEPEEIPVLQDALGRAPVVFINLLEAFEQSDDIRLRGVYDMAKKSCAGGVEIKYFPCEDHNVTTDESVEEALSTIDECLAQGKIVYIHCWSGVGRTGTIVGCWLRRHGHKNAIEKIFELREGTRDPKRPSPRRVCQIEMINRWPVGQNKSGPQLGSR